VVGLMMFLIAYILVLVAHHTLHQLLEHKRRAAIGIFNIVLLLTILPSRLRHNKSVDDIIAHQVQRMSLTCKHEMNDEAILLLDRKLDQSPRGA
jgi:hypothetical protein